MKKGDMVKLTSSGKKIFLNKNAIKNRTVGIIKNISKHVYRVKWDDLVATEELHKDFVRKLTPKEMNKYGY